MTEMLKGNVNSFRRRKGDSMEIKVGCAVVRLHGVPDRDRLQAASERFAKQVMAARKKALKTGRKGVSDVQNG